jgi:quercetin dioxygenase-like cupin family protein
MKINRIEDMIGGWFVGNFEPTAYQTPNFEVGYKFHTKGEVWDNHYHKVATEINYLVRGEMIISGTHLKEGDIFTIYPEEVSIPEFLTDCEVIVVKTPSVKGDKYIIE